jgi:hypothetical protein
MTGGWRKTKARRSKGAVNWKGRKEPREGKGGAPAGHAKGVEDFSGLSGSFSGPSLCISRAAVAQRRVQ